MARILDLVESPEGGREALVDWEDSGVAFVKEHDALLLPAWAFDGSTLRLSGAGLLERGAAVEYPRPLLLFDRDGIADAALVGRNRRLRPAENDLRKAAIAAAAGLGAVGTASALLRMRRERPGPAVPERDEWWG
jgi:hypothetical protein